MATAPDVRVKLAVYRHFAETGRRPEFGDIVRATGLDAAGVIDAYASLREQRLLLLDADGYTIRMAPPFSGAATQHRVTVAGVEYFANCAWDALGVPAALHQQGSVYSRCEESGEPLELAVGVDGPRASDWLFHCLVPAAQWWDDLVFT